MTAKWAWLAVAAVAIGVVAGALSLRHRQPTQAPPAPAAAAIALPASLTLNGKIRAAHVIGVAAQVPGNIDAFAVDVGDEVTQGQELASVGGTVLQSDREEAASSVEKAQARVESADKAVAAAQLEASRANADSQRARAELDRTQKTYDRQRTLNAAGATPRLTYEKAEHDYEAAREQFEAVDKAAHSAADRVRETMKLRDNAQKILTDLNEELSAAQDQLQAGSVESPVDGIVVARNGTVGQPAQELGESLFQIAVDLFDLEVVLEPKPEDLKRLRPHQPALVIIPDLQGISLTGEIKQIEGSQVIISFMSSMPAIRPGMPAEVRLRPE
jgi:multidrug resistance efflux pump